MLISCDDGAESDIRLAELCSKYNIEAIFYWPIEWHNLALGRYVPISFANAEKIAKQFEIGAHGITHRSLTRIPENEAMREIEESGKMLESLFDKKVNNFAPPRGYSNGLLTEFTLKFYDKQRLTKGKGLVHAHPNSGANNNKHWLVRIKEIEAAGGEVNEIWLHSWELDRYPEEWDNLEKYFERTHTRA